MRSTPDERGGNRQTEPTATAPHLDSTVSVSSRMQAVAVPPARHRQGQQSAWLLTLTEPISMSAMADLLLWAG